MQKGYKFGVIKRDDIGVLKLDDIGVTDCVGVGVTERRDREKKCTGGVRNLVGIEH